MYRPDVYLEPEELLRAVALYGPIHKSQVAALFPGRESGVFSVISHFRRNYRVTVGADGYVALPSNTMRDSDLEAAVWVLISFIDKVTFHSSSDFPSKVIFFAKEEVYEVIVVHERQESLINHAFWSRKEENPPRRILVLDTPGQAFHMKVPNTVAFCTVNADGTVSYFKK